MNYNDISRLNILLSGYVCVLNFANGILVPEQDSVI